MEKREKIKGFISRMIKVDPYFVEIEITMLLSPSDAPISTQVTTFNVITQLQPVPDMPLIMYHKD